MLLPKVLFRRVVHPFRLTVACNFADHLNYEGLQVGTQRQPTPPTGAKAGSSAMPFDESAVILNVAVASPSFISFRTYAKRCIVVATAYVEYSHPAVPFELD